MPQWWLLGIRNWRTKPGRTTASILAISLGVGIVIWITSTYKTFEKSIQEQVSAWIGKSHISIESTSWTFMPQDTIQLIEDVDNLEAVSPRLRQSARIRLSTQPIEVNVVGIRPEVEYQFRSFRFEDRRLTQKPTARGGRLLQPSEQGACMIEQSLAQDAGVSVDDTLYVAKDATREPIGLRIVGLFTQRRISRVQAATLIVTLAQAQELMQTPQRVTIIDVLLKDDSPEAIQRAAAEIEARLSAAGRNETVHTAESRVKMLQEVQGQSRFLLLIISSVALLTSLFIVVTTMSMGMSERLVHLGMMRCVGMTRLQMSAVVLCEIVPMCFIGVAVGIPIGLALAWLSVSSAPEYLQGLVVDEWGLRVACVGGLIAGIGSGFIPAVQAAWISPLDATRPQANTPRRRLESLSAIAGLMLIALFQIGIRLMPAHYWFKHSVLLLGTFALYGGYALLAPFIVRWAGDMMAFVAAGILRIRRRLLHDQFVAAPFRSGVICSGFMVALALIIGVSIHGESIAAGWNFPQQIPESYIWMFEPVPTSKVQEARESPNVRDVIAATNFLCYVDTPVRKGITRDRITASTFVAVNYNEFFNAAELEFVEGTPQEVREKMIRGGYVLLPVEAAEQFALSVGDTLDVVYGNLRKTFEVAGVAHSPALDIAAKYFQAERQLLEASSTTIFGSLQDVEEAFDLNFVTFLLMNLELPDTPPTVPEIFEQEKGPAELDHAQLAEWLRAWRGYLPEQADVITALEKPVLQWKKKLEEVNVSDGAAPTPVPPETLTPFTAALRQCKYEWDSLSPKERFELFRAQTIIEQVKLRLGRPNASGGSIRLLKENIDKDLREAMSMITAIPYVGLIIAALGAGNLMMTNVTVRTRQIAILRAVGATKWQIMRLILAEALILGLLGCGAGMILGMHAAYDSNLLTFLIWGFKPEWEVPWSTVTLALATTLGICMLSSILPARHAARSNIISAMSVT